MLLGHQSQLEVCSMAERESETIYKSKTTEMLQTTVFDPCENVNQVGSII